MGACLGREEAARDSQPLIIDVQEVIADEVWSMYYDSIPWCARRTAKRRDYTIEVPMNYYSFEKTDQELNVKNARRDAGASSTSGKKNLLAGKQLSHRDQTSPEHMGLETDFRNSTGEKQTYNFKFEKTRRAAINVSYQKGFSIGNKTNFSIGLPKIMAGGEIGTEIDMHVEVTKTTEQTFEETLTTAATSDITVAPYSHYTATVVMEERTLQAEYKVWVTMSMPAKKAKAFIRNKQGDVVFYYTLNNLSTLFLNKTHHLKDDKGKTREDAVQFVVEGVVNGMQLSSHRIDLDSHDLPRPAAVKDS